MAFSHNLAYISGESEFFLPQMCSWTSKWSIQCNSTK